MELECMVTQTDCVGAYEGAFARLRIEIGRLDPVACKALVGFVLSQQPGGGAVSEVAEVLRNPLGGRESQHIEFLTGRGAAVLLESAPVERQIIVDPRGRRAFLLRAALEQFGPVFPTQLTTIFQFTSKIVWLQSSSSPFGSAAFHEVPHCSFFSDGALFSISPTIVTGSQPTHYAIFENLYHESLHHQLSAAVVLVAEGYLRDKSLESLEFQVISRGISWSLPNILQAAYVYVHLVELRYLFHMSGGHDLTLHGLRSPPLEWARTALQIGNELVQLLEVNIDSFSPYWRRPIVGMRKELTNWEYRLSEEPAC